MPSEKTRDGESNTALYRIWWSMRQRCNNPRRIDYSRYGGRGVKVCPEWQDETDGYRVFRSWALQNGYSPKLQMDRRDNGGPYSPDNCRFVSASINARNRRSNHHVAAFGTSKLLTEWVEDPRCVVKQTTLRARLKCDWDPEVAITKPPRRTLTVRESENK